MDWGSATLLANLDRFVLQHGYRCEAVLIAGDTVSTGTSMIRDAFPDIASELWTDSFGVDLTAAIKDGKVVITGASLSGGGQEGFWVPRYLVERNPELARIEGVIANINLFRRPGESAPRFMSCPDDWACHVAVGNLFNALGLGATGFTLEVPESGQDLAQSLRSAVSARQPWFGYYWAPTALLGELDMVLVDFGSGANKPHFLECITRTDCASPQPTMFPPAPIKTLVASEFAERAPDVIAYLSNRSFSNAAMSRLLAWMEANRADGAAGAVHFLKEQESVWSSWVDADAAQRIKAALDVL
tara:strand:- start:6963 stop:7868 length:906 start_codon:yes stop_codon:yes gene_type:complete